jgi:violaxanthin de-epoxidase
MFPKVDGRLFWVQIRCGDLYNDEAIGAFNTCAVTQKKCVPQIPDRGDIVLPTGDALVPEFNVDDFQGRWYISSGLNKDFDIFDCQVRDLL